MTWLGKKSFKILQCLNIGNKDYKKVQPLFKMLPKMSDIKKVLIKFNICLF